MLTIGQTIMGVVRYWAGPGQAGRATAAGVGNFAGRQAGMTQDEREQWGQLVTDGEVDNATVMNEALARASLAGQTGMTLPPGRYGVGSTVVIPRGMSLHMAPGAMIVALQGFRGQAVVHKEPCERGDHRWAGRLTGGAIDGGKQAITGIHVPGSCRLDIADIEVIDCLFKGIHIGVPGDSWGYEVNIRGVRCAIDLTTAHAPGSIGIHYERVTDSYVNQAVVIGYETGVASESSANDFSQVHVWSVTAHGPLKRNFYCNGWGDSYTQCYADAPFDGGETCFGFLVNRPFNRFINCRVYCNKYTFDNTVVGFMMTSSGTHGSYMNNLFTASAEHRIKAAFTGSLEAATILGNGYDPNVLAGRENRIPSDTGGISYIPPLEIGASQAN